MAEDAKVPCPLNGSLVLKGEHYPCTQMDQMAKGSKDHSGWAHSNKEIGAVWN